MIYSLFSHFGGQREYLIHAKKRLFFWGWVILFAFLLNTPISFFIYGLWNENIGIFFAFICSFPLILAISLFAGKLINEKRYDIFTMLLLCMGIGVWIGFILKRGFHALRPYELFDLLAPYRADGASFPSMHALIVFLILPLCKEVWKKWNAVWISIALCISFARIYLHVHFLIDVVIGAFIGYEIGNFVLYLQKKHRIFERLFELFQNQLEVRRQLLHLFFGLCIVFLYKSSLITLEIILVSIFLLGLISLFVKRKKLSKVYRFLSFFEREKHLEMFPMRGVIYFLIGAYISFIIFPENISSASILMLSCGDAVTNIFGKYFGKHAFFYNRKKTLEGSISGIIFSTMIASIFFPIFPSLIASLAAFFVESLPLQIGKFEIDDNVTIPLVAGAVLWILL